MSYKILLIVVGAAFGAVNAPDAGLVSIQGRKFPAACHIIPSGKGRINFRTIYQISEFIDIL